MTHRLLIPVTPGELADRISILRVKLRNLGNREKLAKVGTELHELTDIWDASPYFSRMSAETLRCIRELDSANQQIWDAENDIRGEADGWRISAAARLARDANDRRTAAKSRLNAELDVETTEVKEYGGSTT